MELAEVLECAPPDFTFSPRFNVAPSQAVPVLINENDKRCLRLMNWGLVPSWAKDPSIGNKMINARAETITQKPSFRKPFERQRCLIPVDGFYEWQKVTGARAKIPTRIVMKDRRLFALAGIWDIWKKPDGGELRSFAIITTAANDLMRSIHERMPVILSKQDWTTWLDPKFMDISKLTELFKPFPSEAMETYEVSTAVNSPRNDVSECFAVLTSGHREIQT